MNSVHRSSFIVHRSIKPSPPTNYYTILGVSPEADTEAIRDAYKALARRWHPDRNPGDKHAEEQIKLINEAYAVLRDPLRRRMHDLLLAQGADVRAAGRASERVQRDYERAGSGYDAGGFGGAYGGGAAGAGPFGPAGFDPRFHTHATWRPTTFRLYPWEMWMVRWLLLSFTWLARHGGPLLLSRAFWLSLFFGLSLAFVLLWPLSLIIAIALVVAAGLFQAALLGYIYLRIKLHRG